MPTPMYTYIETVFLFSVCKIMESPVAESVKLPMANTIKREIEKKCTDALITETHQPTCQAGG